MDKSLERLERVVAALDDSEYVKTDEFAQVFTALLGVLQKQLTDSQRSIEDAGASSSKVSASALSKAQEIERAFDTLRSELFKRVEEIELTPGNPGKDADEESIYQRLLAQLPPPPEPVTETPEETVEKVNKSKVKVAKSQVEGLEDIERIAKISADNTALPPTTPFINGKRAKNITFSGATVTHRDDTATVTITGGGGGGAVDSVNGQTGEVVLDTGDIAEGGNLYFTDERAQDAVGGMATGSIVYVDATPSLSLDGDEATPGNSQYYGTDGSGVKGFHNLPAGGAVAWGDITGTLSDQTDLQTALDGKAAALTADQNYVSDAELTVLQATSGTNTGDVTVTDSSEIDFTLTGQDLTASIVMASIDETKLDASVNASLDLADSAVQDLSDLGITATASELNTLDGITATVTELNYTDGVTSAIQTQLDGKQPLDAQLTDIAGLAVTDGNFIVGNGTNFVAESGATARTSLGVAIGSDVLAYDAGVQQIADLADPNADRLLFWDDSSSAYAYLTASTGLTITTTSLTVRSASTTQTGIAEAAIDSEVTAGTDAARYVSPDALAGSTIFGRKAVSIQVTDGTTDVATGDGKAYFTIPESLNGMNLVRAQATVVTAGTTNATTVMIHNKTDAADMLSGAISIASGGTVGTVGTINGAADDVATNDVIRIDVDSVSTTAPKGLMVVLEFQLP